MRRGVLTEVCKPKAVEQATAMDRAGPGSLTVLVTLGTYQAFGCDMQETRMDRGRRYAERGHERVRLTVERMEGA
jgi:hypothetical protein